LELQDKLQALLASFIHQSHILDQELQAIQDIGASFMKKKMYASMISLIFILWQMFYLELHDTLHYYQNEVLLAMEKDERMVLNSICRKDFIMPQGYFGIS